MKRTGGILIGLILAGCQAEQAITDQRSEAVAQACEGIPRPANARLPLSDASDDWFQVYETAANVYSIVEPYHYQETISHLIVGEDRALLFDTGMGFLPIRPVVERITSLPITVLNSHTHYDHVGGNSEFSEILAIDSDYTRANMAGFPNEKLSVDLDLDAFCKGTPAGFDRSTFRTRPWKSTRSIADGEFLDIGGRTLRVLHVPGHTPDATALLDAENGLLFTGDSYYDGAIWLFVPETSLADYERTIERLAEVGESVHYLLGAHNAARVDAPVLGAVKAAFGKLISGDLPPTDDDEGRLLFNIDGIEFLTAAPVLDGQRGATSRGGSGLDTWE
jgi:glyoxylase-like metal-dependent hydrolase (beta-lactamase superfamily II)